MLGFGGTKIDFFDGRAIEFKELKDLIYYSTSFSVCQFELIIIIIKKKKSVVVFSTFF